MKTLFWAAILLEAATVSLSAGTYSFFGTFTTDDQVQLFNVGLSTDSIVTFVSFGYGGGTNGAGTVIQPGGFDSEFTWFDSTGNQIGTNDDGGCGTVNSYNGSCLDAYFQGFLSAGTYTLALTESGNDPNGNLSDGFSEQGNGDFTASGTCAAFCDTFGNQDKGKWAVDIVNVDSVSAVPEPGTVLPAFSGLFVIALVRRRRVPAFGL